MRLLVVLVLESYDRVLEKLRAGLFVRPTVGVRTLRQFRSNLPDHLDARTTERAGSMPCSDDDSPPGKANRGHLFSDPSGV